MSGPGSRARGPLADLPARRRSRSARRTISRIVPWFEAGAVVTTPRHQVDVIVTEYGAAELEGRTSTSAARRLRDRPPGLPRRAARGRRAGERRALRAGRPLTGARASALSSIGPDGSGNLRHLPSGAARPRPRGGGQAGMDGVRPAGRVLHRPGKRDHRDARRRGHRCDRPAPSGRRPLPGPRHPDPLRQGGPGRSRPRRSRHVLRPARLRRGDGRRPRHGLVAGSGTRSARPSSATAARSSSGRPSSSGAPARSASGARPTWRSPRSPPPRSSPRA